MDFRVREVNVIRVYRIGLEIRKLFRKYFGDVEVFFFTLVENVIKVDECLCEREFLKFKDEIIEKDWRFSKF